MELARLGGTMDIRQLRYFVRIVECGSLSKAARQLLLAQPALSQQLTKLEEEVGRPLLHRSSKGISPTDNGLALYHHARFMIRQLDQALSIARNETGAVQGMVTVGLPATTVAAIGLPLLRRVRERYPHILLNIVEGMSGHIAQLMRNDQLDLAVLFFKDAVSDVTVEPLQVEELFLMLPLHSRLVPAGRKTITVAEVTGIPLILPTGAHGLRRRIEAEFENRGLAINVVAEIDSLSLLMNCVYDGMGATIKPMGAVMQEGARGRYWRHLRFSDLRFRRRNFLYSAPTGRLTAAAAAVARELKEAVRELIEDPAWSGFEKDPEERSRPASHDGEAAAE